MRTKQLLACVATTAILLTGCGSESESTDNAAGGLDSAMSGFSSDAGSMSLDMVVQEFQKQLDSQQSQIDAAKATAKTLADDQLDKLIGNLDSKIADARSKLGKLTKADSGSAAELQKELAGLMKELPALYDEIKTKIKVLGG